VKGAVEDMKGNDMKAAGERAKGKTKRGKERAKGKMNRGRRSEWRISGVQSCVSRKQADESSDSRAFFVPPIRADHGILSTGLPLNLCNCHDCIACPLTPG
jgi:hypothetical protein